MSQQFHFKSLFNGKEWLSHVTVDVVDGTISAINEGASAEECLSGKVIPGFIDTQVNGGGGALFNFAPTLDGLKTMMAAHAQFGTVAMLPTLITDDVDVIAAAANTIASAIAANEPGILGVHFEGPHLSVPKKGTHEESKIRPISEAEWAVYERGDLGIKMVTLAPECVEIEDIKRLVRAGVIVCLGHTNATFEETNAALAAGATGFTHLYNAMSAFTSRAEGVVGAALLADDAWCGIIVDRHHVSAGALRVALRSKPKGKLVLVTDAMSLIGTDESEFEFFGRKVIRQGDRLNSTTGELAGSHLDMLTAVNNTVVDLGVSFEEAVAMASEYPAAFINASSLGNLQVGSAASWVQLSEDNTKVLTTVIDGQIIYQQQ
ncbi:N-acetylglucosamine-6-phosphate deacetylase [Umboniibacter marinipuniceus]|uniref:N-acetylglucosamine 6-phosphate deacetylase n=1 Tax=Umboniibacter marinipuniceus TaxID=569599 RepID=A0A3M0AAV9_9GAMM|nr:N-acetylglucosamine-6-phosphate deacetylase [Umboniibacter marinipuniceus]RMA82281.1 N-acetylglucosamine 6-phosphate deacetylase [Umboniibacter marinipuniceus]